jgi:hypothetical protein
VTGPAVGLRADTVALRAAAPAFDDLADQVGAILDGLDAALTAEGACWGTDEIGTTFAGSYLPAVEQVRAAFGAVRRACAETATGITIVADNADAADGRASRRLGS